jgi:hypothetical protein
MVLHQLPKWSRVTLILGLFILLGGCASMGGGDDDGMSLAPTQQTERTT